MDADHGSNSVDEDVAASIVMEKTHPSLTSKTAFLAAKALPYPPYMPMQNAYLEDSFFVRPCYAQYYEHLIGIYASTRKVGGVPVTITGTPGIGKSIFMAYFFLRFRLENPTEMIMMQAYDRLSRLMEVTVWKNGNAYRYQGVAVGSNDVVRYQDEAAVYLVDGPPPHPYKRKFYLCFVSPNEAWFKTMSKNPYATKVFMPVRVGRRGVANRGSRARFGRITGAAGSSRRLGTGDL